MPIALLFDIYIYIAPRAKAINLAWALERRPCLVDHLS